MRKTSTELLEQGIQAPSPAPDLIPAQHQLRTHIGIGTANGGTSLCKNSKNHITGKCPLLVLAAKRRQSKAHGASHGSKVGNEQAPGGAKE